MTESNDEQIYRIEEPAPASDNNSTSATDASQTPTAEASRDAQPTYGNEPPHRSNSNKGLWITIALLVAIILVGGTWVVASHFMQPADAVPADTLATDTNAVEVVGYETDDTPSDDPSAASLEEPTEEEAAARPHVSDFVGNISDENGEGVVSVGLSLTFEGSGSVLGTSKNGDKSYSITGRFDSDTQRLLIYEDGGGCFDGTLYEDGRYVGKYHGASETPSDFALSLSVAR